jgi:hypothetical protein
LIESGQVMSSTSIAVVIGITPILSTISDDMMMKNTVSRILLQRYEESFNLKVMLT